MTSYQTIESRRVGTDLLVRGKRDPVEVLVDLTIRVRSSHVEPNGEGSRVVRVGTQNYLNNVWYPPPQGLRGRVYLRI